MRAHGSERRRSEVAPATCLRMMYAALPATHTAAHGRTRTHAHTHTRSLLQAAGREFSRHRASRGIYAVPQQHVCARLAPATPPRYGPDCTTPKGLKATMASLTWRGPFALSLSLLSLLGR